MLDNKIVLVTGGTSPLGQRYVEGLLNDAKPKRVFVLSADEDGLLDMKIKLGGDSSVPLKFVVGSVRDKTVLNRSFEGVDVVFHADVLHFPFVAEYNPFEAVKVNILGAMNIINAAIDNQVEKVIALSPQSSVNPATLSGLTERTAERIFVAGNSYSRKGGSRFSVVRIGSVFGIKNNLVSSFLKMRETGEISISDPRRTRFWMSYEDIVSFTLKCLELMVKGEIFIPKLPSIRDIDLAKAIAPNCARKIIGIHPGEVLHENLLSREDSQFALEYDDYYAIIPFYLEMGRILYYGPTQGRPCHVGFSYRSDTNAEWLSAHDVQEYLKGNKRERS
jgi:UDP-N-acetylglucosamine 4,6-dehydratase